MLIACGVWIRLQNMWWRSSRGSLRRVGDMLLLFDLNVWEIE
jgi:hypothetical protein